MQNYVENMRCSLFRFSTFWGKSSQKKSKLSVWAEIWYQDQFEFVKFNDDIHFLEPRWQPKGSYKIGSVCPSIRPSFCLSGCFLGIVRLVFSKFWHDARNAYEVVRDSRIFQKKIFCSKNWENGPKMDQKQGFLNKLKNFVVNFH